MNEILYPGSFDPITKGHLDVILRLRKLYSNVVVLVAESLNKKYLFSIDERAKLIKTVLGEKKGIEIATTKELTVEFAKRRGIRVIARSVRSTGDWEHEYALAVANKLLAPGIETVFMLADPTLATISSSLVREISAFGGDTRPFVPEEVAEALIKKGKI